MMIKIIIKLVFTKFSSIPCLLFFGCMLKTQQNQSSETRQGEIDLSKPNNLYTQVNTVFEHQNGTSQDLIRLRANIQYAFDPDNLVLAKVPLLYNLRTQIFGPSDIQSHYFSAVKRNITQKFIANAPFADVSFPTGSFENGLGTRASSLAGGVIFGASEQLSLFPRVSYVQVKKPTTDLISDVFNFVSNGIGLQFSASDVFDRFAYLLVNHTPTFLNTDGDWKTIWGGELNFNKILMPNKFKMNVGWLPNFSNNLNV